VTLIDAGRECSKRCGKMLANDKIFIDHIRKKDPDAIDVEFRVVSDEPKLLGDGKE